MRRSQSERTAEARRRMLAEAVGIVAKGGFRGLALASLGTRAGFSREAPRYHFGSREGLVDALVEVLLAEFDLPTMGGADQRGVDRLHSAAREFRARIESQPEMFRAYLLALAEALVDPAAQARVSDANMRALDFIQRHVLVGMESGGLRSTTGVRAYAANLLAVIRGAPELWLLGDSRLDMTAIGGEFGSLLQP